jgi:hypothetical protein
MTFRTARALPTLIQSVSLVLAFSATPVLAGVGSSGGADVLARDPGDAWFVGTGQSFNYCIELAPDFGATVEFARTQIDRAFRTWADYLATKWALGASSPSTSAIYQTACSANTDVTFYLGVTNPVVQQAAAAYQQPIAFVYRISQDSSVGRSTGFVWVGSQPYWSKLNNLVAILLHETGHILGNAHVPGTIMDPAISEQLWNRDSYDADDDGMQVLQQTQIDQRRELVVCDTCKATFNGVVSQFTAGLKHTDPSPPPAGVRSAEDTFQLFTGRKASGHTYTAWTYQPIPSDWQPGSGQPFPTVSGKATLTLRDSAGSVDFDITVGTRLSADFEGSIFAGEYPAVFFTQSKASGYFPVSGSGGMPEQLYGTMKTKAGRELAVIIERNSTAPNPLRIYYMDGPATFELMLTRLVNDTGWQPYVTP